MTRARSLVALAALATACAGLAGCGATSALGVDEYLPRRPDVYDRPVVNGATRVEPFAQRLRYPVPDGSWERESASEYEPWTKRALRRRPAGDARLSRRRAAWPPPRGRSRSTPNAGGRSAARPS